MFCCPGIRTKNHNWFGQGSLQREVTKSAQLPAGCGADGWFGFQTRGAAEGQVTRSRCERGLLKLQWQKKRGYLRLTEWKVNAFHFLLYQKDLEEWDSLNQWYEEKSRDRKML